MRTPHSLSQILGAEEFGPLQPEDDVEPIPVERNFMISVSHCFGIIYFTLYSQFQLDITRRILIIF